MFFSYNVFDEYIFNFVLLVIIFFVFYKNMNMLIKGAPVGEVCFI